MKKNKWYIYFSCLLIAFILFVSVGISVNASSSQGGNSFICGDNYIYNDDYENVYSINQPYVMNYWYIDTQTSPNTNISNPYFYIGSGSQYDFVYNKIQFNYYYDSLYLNDILYNVTSIGIFDEIMYDSLVCGFYQPFYIYANDFENDYHTLIFNGISIPLRVNVYYSISYIISKEINEYEVYTDMDMFYYTDGIYTDDTININDYVVLEHAFNKETPYYVENPLIRVNYIYYELTIDWTDYIQGTNYSIDYRYPIMDWDTYEDYLMLPDIWDHYDLSLNPINIDFGQGLLNSVNSFLQFEILPNFTLFNLLLIVVAVPLLIYILKLFLGG